MVVNIHFAGLALRGLAGLAVEDAALPLAAGRLTGQKLEGVLARRLHAEGCPVTGVLGSKRLLVFCGLWTRMVSTYIVVLVEDQP